MGIIALIVRLLIAGVFFVAGIAKLSDLQRTRKGVRDFGLPNWSVNPLAVCLPVVELMVVTLLIPSSAVLWGGLGALGLLLIFIVGISINLALGRSPECNCFGQLHSNPIGWPTLARNCVLVCGVAFVLWEERNGSPMSVLGWTLGLSNGEIAGIGLGTTAIVIVAAEGWLLFHLFRQNGRLLLRMDAFETHVGNSGASSLPLRAHSGLPVGSAAPRFELPALSDGSILTLDTLRAQRLPIALIFSDPECGPCSALLPEIARWHQEYAATLTVALISRGSQKANHMKIANHRLKFIALQKDREVSASYNATGTPAAVLVGADGKIASPVVMGAQAIAGLVASGAAGTISALAGSTNGRYVNDFAQPTVPIDPRIGYPAPSLRLPDLSGKIVDLSTFLGRALLVIFWNPSCGFCARMLPQLKAWEDDNPVGAPQLLVISSGTVEANLAMRLSAHVVLDQTFASGFAFHVRGTPSAVLVDAEGKIASGVASGAPAVFALANVPQDSSAALSLPDTNVGSHPA
jgi:thiol-disulfide isomerase/thioredoxin/uncharacterized membrane protein YphA (DoxX/SURF4 family)